MTSRRGRAVAGGALVVDGLVGIDVPGGRRRAGIVGSLVMLVVGLVFVGVGVMVHRQHQPYSDGLSATGTVTAVQTSRDHRGRTMYAGIVTFTAASGRKVSFTEPETSTQRPGLGTSVQVSYRKGDPQSARVIPGRDWMAYLIMAVGGLTALSGAVVFVIRLITLIAGLRLLSGAAREARASRTA
ncbi:DUF3592 domain-containing protein [Streptomyces sp. NPDC050523]|uniref:DUF3592 domain-containing protein n=1 Tax=Streptomyces sp. NPDC050523 TaxID=3365622 RepID=UPI0037A0FD97